MALNAYSCSDTPRFNIFMQNGMVTLTESTMALLVREEIRPKQWKRAADLIRNQGKFGNNPRDQVPVLVAAFAIASILAYHGDARKRQEGIEALFQQLHSAGMDTVPEADFDSGVEIAFKAVYCNVVTFEGGTVTQNDDASDEETDGYQ